MKKLLSTILIFIVLFSLVACEKDSSTDDTNQNDNVLTVNAEDIPAGSVVCVGSLDLDGNYIIDFDVSSESGVGIMVALNEKEDIEYIDSELWMLSHSSATQTLNESQPTDSFEGTYYVYIGANNTDLGNVTGTITYTKK